MEPIVTRKTPHPMIGLPHELSLKLVPSLVPFPSGMAEILLQKYQRWRSQNSPTYCGGVDTSTRQVLQVPASSYYRTAPWGTPTTNRLPIIGQRSLKPIVCTDRGAVAGCRTQKLLIREYLGYDERRTEPAYERRQFQPQAGAGAELWRSHTVYYRIIERRNCSHGPGSCRISVVPLVLSSVNHYHHGARSRRDQRRPCERGDIRMTNSPDLSFDNAHARLTPTFARILLRSCQHVPQHPPLQHYC